MGDAVRLLVACMVLRMLAPVAGVAETVDHSTSAEYWKCKNWPEALKRKSVMYRELSVPADDDSFVWFCPNRCNSMPYFDIKLTLDFWKRTSQNEGAKGSLAYFSGAWRQLSEWKGNIDYRATFPSNLQSNPVAWPEAQVSDVGTCRKNRMTENMADQETQCWPEMKHLNNKFVTPVYAGGVWESSIPLDPCRTGANAVEMNPMACFRPEKENIFVTPAYVFYPGSTPLSTSPTNECRVTRVDASNPATKIAQYWSNPPTFQSHSLIWKSFSTIFSTSGWKDERKTTAEGTIDTLGENYKHYEWMCSFEYFNILPPEWRTGWNYYEARLYESGCQTTPCGHFRTQSCWQNAYSFAAAPCKWRNRFGERYVTFEEVTNNEFAASMHAYGGGKYILQFDRRTMEASKQGQAALAETETTLAISIGERFRIALKPDFSCNQCEFTDQVKGMVLADKNKNFDEVAQCVACRAFEKLSPTRHLCEECEMHRVRARAWASRASCSDCPTSVPMRRLGGGDDTCTECQVLDYFNGADPRGCVRLASVMNGRTAAEIKGVDEYYSEGKPRAIMPKKYRVVQAQTGWLDAVFESPCAYTTYAVARATELSFRRWCGHREIVREQQALLAVGNASYLYRTENTTAGFAAIGDVCGATLRATSGGLFDLQCTDNRSSTLSISVVRGGDPTRCTVCPGAQYTRACPPTYHPGLAGEETAYFASGARLSSAGTCAACYSQCVDADHYMSPVELSCMWNGSAQGRVTDALSALPSAALFYWYKLAPCKPCVDATLNTTHAMLVQQCGNKRTYRTWDALQSTLMPSTVRSIPMTRTCCSQHRNAQPCTQSQLEEDTREAWIARECKAASELEDLERVLETYCPPGWYVDEACAQVAPNAWVPDCCKRCDACGPGLFKTETYAACTGATFIDTEQNGCEQSCLSNSYRKDGRCYRCEQCSTTGTGEHL